MSESAEAAWGSIQYALVTRPASQAEKFNELVRAYGEAKRQEAERDLAECKAALEEALEYVQHTSWRCGHPDRYPYDPDCSCGLVCSEGRWREVLDRGVS